MSELTKNYTWNALMWGMGFLAGWGLAKFTLAWTILFFMSAVMLCAVKRTKGEHNE